MAKQLLMEDVEVGTEIPPLVKHPTMRQMVMWAGAAEEYGEIHYDKDFVRSMGLPDVLVAGPLKAAFLSQLLTNWIGEDGSLKRLSCSQRSMDFPGKDVISKGKVVKKYDKDDAHYIECEVWIANSEGEKTTLGTAVVTLPSRGGSRFQLCVAPGNR